MKNIYILPTDKPSRLIMYSKLLGTFRLLDEPCDDWKGRLSIYITSYEEIKEGDWYLTNKNTLCKCIGADDKYVYSLEAGSSTKCKKIILSTDQDLIKDGIQVIDDEFLEWFVKNPSCEYVEIKKVATSKMLIERLGIKVHYMGYKIIIPKEEPKQETTLEEGLLQHIKFCLECKNESQAIRLIEKYGFEKQEQDKNKYSEEIIDILDNVRYWETCPDEYKVIIENFIEQFKNNEQR